MRLLIGAVLSAVLPFLVSLYFYRREKCGIWLVIMSPVIGLFLLVISLFVLICTSGDM